MTNCAHCKEEVRKSKHGQAYHRIEVANREFYLATICSCGCNTPVVSA